MRVVLLGTGVLPIPPPAYGGVERTIHEYAGALRAAGHDVTVVPGVPPGGRVGEYRFAFRLRRVLSPLGYDVLHAATPVVANRLALASLPYVYTSHSRHWFEPGGLAGRWGLWLEQRAVRRAAASVALTERLSRRIDQLTGPPVGPRAVIPIGVDVGTFRPDWASRSGTIALGVGIVRPFKRWELAAAALRGTGLTFRLVGPSPDPEYAAQVRAAGDRVEIAGELDPAALSAEFARADLLIHPSRVELLPGAVLQGLAAGLPVLGGPAIAGLVPEGAGATAPATVTDPELTQFLHEQAVAYARDPGLRRQSGEAARAFATARYAWTAVVDAHLALYRALLDGGRLTR